MIKIIEREYEEKLSQFEERLNEFEKKYNIIDIKYSQYDRNGVIRDAVLIHYNEKKQKESISNEIIITEPKTELEKKIAEFVEFRKAIKKPFKGVSKAAWIKKLLELSSNNEETAIKIIDQSIANGWQGIFELKTNNNGATINTIQQY